MRVPDSRLDWYQTCPLATFAEPEPVEKAARDLLAWTALEAFNGRQVPLAVLRKKFVYFWHTYWPENATRDGEKYWAGVRVGRSVAAKLFLLFRKYDVRRPMQPYQVSTGGHLITGEYAILARRRPDPRVQDGPYVLIPHGSRPRTFPRPDLAALAAWKHAMMHEEDGNRLGIYHLPLLSGQFWRNPTIQEPLVLPWLIDVVEAMATRRLRYPAPSGYCDDCLSKACMKVFDV